MRILFISDKYSNRGGEGNYSIFFVDFMRKKGHEVEVICQNFNTNIIKSLIQDYFFSYFSLNWKKVIEEKVKNFKPDIIFLFGITRIISPYSLISVKNNVPIIFQMSGAMQFNYSGAWKGYFRKNPMKIFFNISFFRILLSIPKKFLHNNLFLKIVDHYIAPSKTTAEITIKKMGISEKDMSVIRHPSLFNIENKVHKKKNFILYVGRLNKEKGLNYLIKAFNIIHENNINLKLLIVGEGPERKKLEFLSNKLGLSKNIKFLGLIEHEKIKKIYQKALLLILPSIVKENFGLVILEAMSQGTPVITTNIGGQRELVLEGYNGFLTNPEDYNDLAKKIERVLLNSDERLTLSLNSIKFSKKFTKEKNIKEIEILFRNILQNRNILKYTS